jgi:carboxypeptidase C (cathepsin A)
VGESFAGQYTPRYASKTRRRFDSVVLIDPFIDPYHLILGIWEHFCVPGREKQGLNSTACEAMEQGYPECETHADICRATQDPTLCQTAWTVCNDKVGKWFEIRKGSRNPYDDRKECETTSDYCETGKWSLSTNPESDLQAGAN